MIQRKSFCILWLVLWAELSRAELPAQRVISATGAAGEAQGKNAGTGDPTSSKLQRKEGATQRRTLLDDSKLDDRGKAWKSMIEMPIIERAEAFTLAYDAFEERFQNASLVETSSGNRDLLTKRTGEKWNPIKRVGNWVNRKINKYVHGCTEFKTSCPAPVVIDEGGEIHYEEDAEGEGLGDDDAHERRTWLVVRGASWKSNLLTALSLAGILIVGALIAGPLVGLAIGGGAIAAKAVWARGKGAMGKPTCEHIEFKRLKEGKTSCYESSCLDVDIKLPYMTMSMTLQFVANAVNEDESEARAFKTEAARNGRSIFACNVLMWAESQWDTKMGNSELFTDDPVLTSEQINDGSMSKREKLEEVFRQRLVNDKGGKFLPEQQALQYCRYLLCKHGYVKGTGNPVKNGREDPHGGE